MADTKAFASLTADLLARKGDARPAMRRQPQLAHHDALAHDDLGWNDMGYDVDPSRQNDQDEAAPHRNPALGLSPMHGGDYTISQHEIGRREIGRWIETADMRPINDMVAVPTTSAEPEVRRQLQTLADAVVTPAITPEMTAPRTSRRRASKSTTGGMAKRGLRRQPGARGKYAFTLRLNPDQHLRLRQASAASHRSMQQLLVAIIDQYFSGQPENDPLIARLPVAPSAASSEEK